MTRAQLARFARHPAVATATGTLVLLLGASTLLDNGVPGLVWALWGLAAGWGASEAATAARRDHTRAH